MTATEKAQQALDKAQAADRAKESKAQAKAVDGVSKAKADELKENDMRAKENLGKLEGDAGDSKRETVIVERKYSEQTHKIFVSTVITKKGKPVLEQFRVPVEVEVSLPVEIIAALKDRKIAKQKDNKQTMVSEFVITKV